MSLTHPTPDLERLRAEFPILARKTYLNSCSLGALSRRSETYLDDFRELWHDMGASAWYEHWLGRIEELRSRVAAFWGSAPEETALLPSTSVALSVVAESVAASGRNQVVCTELDFPTLAYQWAVKPDVELVVLDSPDGIRIDPEQFEAAVGDRTLFLATSHVFFTTGYVQDIEALARVARDAGAYCLIDGYQGAGQVPLDLSSTGVDFYTAGPLKWLLGGPGLAYLYVRRELVRQLAPRITSWFAADGQFDFDLRGFRYRSDARRFEMGTPALPTVHTALGGQEIIDEVGIETIVARNRHLTERLVSRCKDAGMTLRLAEPERRSAIVMVRHADPTGAVRHLAEHGVIVDHRPGFVRISPHVYNNEEEIDRCVDVLAAYSG
jgi:selenocysteine lyase/cysteine desulfurase